MVIFVNYIHEMHNFISNLQIFSTGNVVSYLNVSIADVLHGGYYTCLARNILGLKSHSAMIKIYGIDYCL